MEVLQSVQPLLAVEVGGGSGLISAALAAALPATFFLLTDLNPAACRASSSTAAQNKETVM